MDYKKKYLKYKNKYLQIKHKLNGGMEMGEDDDNSWKNKKSSKPLNIYAKTFVQKDSKKPAEDDNSEEKKKSSKPLNIYAKTFVQKDSKKPAEDDNSEEIKKSSKPLNIYAKTFVQKDSKKSAENNNWKSQLLTYWENEKNRENFGEFSDFVSYWKEHLKCVVDYKTDSRVRLKETNETGVVIAETENEGDGVIYYVVKLNNGEEVAVQNIDLEFEDVSMNLSLLPVDDLDFECYLDRIEPTNTLVIITHNLGGQTRYLDPHTKQYLTVERGQMVENGDGDFFIESLNANLPVPVLDPEGDIHLYQEWQQQCSAGQREFDLAINMKNKYFNGADYSSRLGNLSRTLNCPPVYLIDTEEIEDIRTLSIINIHNMIASDTSSKGQINRLIEILRYIQMRHNNNPNLIIGGDFNFDFFNIEEELIILKETLINSTKDKVREEAEYLLATLEILYRYIYDNFIIFPHTGEQTNVWSLEEGEVLNEKCVDYVMLSRNLEDCIDFDETICIIDRSKVGASFDEEAVFFENDFDHAKVTLKIVWKNKYRVVY